MLLPAHAQTLDYIEDAMPPETPVAFGLHPNAEIGFKLREADRFCLQLTNLQPRQTGGGGGLSPEERAKGVLDDILERLPELFDLEEIRSRIDEFTPYIMVAIQVLHPICSISVQLCGAERYSLFSLCPSD